ncbi:MAG: extracellular solute-binding protein [Lachnospiraceae bacterium]|nr:extracellular solute-binding protein [Lachnospiraceae bacterium]
MKKGIKKLLCLMLVVAMASTVFTACSSGSKGPRVELKPMTEDVITLTYAFWEDKAIVDLIMEDWNALYPNITINAVEYTPSTFNENLKALFAANDAPDVFGIVGSIDFAIENGMLLDMTGLWELDPDAKDGKILKGINDFEIGYFGTDCKWATPIKFYPHTALINKYMVENTANKEMPDTDWTWDEYEEFVESFQGMKDDRGYNLYGMNAADGTSPITWYPIAADGNCIGEFGWTESEDAEGGCFDMENWAYGVTLYYDWIEEGVIALQDEETRNNLWEGSYPQDIGLVAVRNEAWNGFVRYFDNDEQPMLNNNAIFVPYIMPHVETVAKEDYTYIGILDMGGINSTQIEYGREAYEVLKFFAWGAEGWKAKLKYYPDMTADETYSVMGAKTADNFPICLDDEVWEAFTDIYANWKGDPYGRGDYFKDFFAKVKAARWTCLGSPQIPGFGTWLEEFYWGEEFVPGYYGIETAVAAGAADPYAYYEQLEKRGNELNQEKIDEINAMLK